MRGLVLAALVALLGSTAHAEEPRRILLSFGWDDLKGYRERSPVLGIDYDFRSIGTSGRWKWRAGAQVFTDGDLWAGVGVSYSRPVFKGDWFFTASFGPGLYYRDNERPGVKHLHYPMFRTDGGLGRVLESGATVSVILSHLSDGGLDEPAGSTETLLVRYGRSF